MSIQDVAERLTGGHYVDVRYPREIRDSVQSLRTLPILTGTGAQITLGTVAQFVLRDGPPILVTENARLAGWVYIDARGRRS